jgi:hypothetical protein
MRVEDLSIGELVEFDSEDGVVRFAGRRALIIYATAKGSLGASAPPGEPARRRASGRNETARAMAPGTRM